MTNKLMQDPVFTTFLGILTFIGIVILFPFILIWTWISKIIEIKKKKKEVK